ncbi:MAG: TIGR04100 family radical SAM protein [Clostridia bacterium]|nr:TIGR04100 family radical SAM protein [Clostridia bacterium]
MTIFYPGKDNMYINITNKCTCNCDFCVRLQNDSVMGNDPLWLEHEPSFDEIKEAFDKITDKEQYKQFVFCGYGEPTVRLDLLLQVAKYIKEQTNAKIRVNTNGTSDLVYGKKTAPMFSKLIDSISISLNSYSSDSYDELCKPIYENTFDSIIEFAKEIKDYVPDVRFTVVDVIGKEDIEKCKKIADQVGINLRVRHYITQ